VVVVDPDLGLTLAWEVEQVEEMPVKMGLMRQKQPQEEEVVNKVQGALEVRVLHETVQQGLNILVDTPAVLNHTEAQEVGVGMVVEVGRTVKRMVTLWVEVEVDPGMLGVLEFLMVPLLQVRVLSPETLLILTVEQLVMVDLLM
jgi:hypothetical protein